MLALSVQTLFINNSFRSDDDESFARLTASGTVVIGLIASILLNKCKTWSKQAVTACVETWLRLSGRVYGLTVCDDAPVWELKFSLTFFTITDRIPCSSAPSHTR